jgi:hypothetical protein
MERHMYREVLTFVDWIHGSEIHGNQLRCIRISLMN